MVTLLVGYFLAPFGALSWRAYLPEVMQALCFMNVGKRVFSHYFGPFCTFFSCCTAQLLRKKSDNLGGYQNVDRCFVTSYIFLGGVRAVAHTVLLLAKGGSK